MMMIMIIIAISSLRRHPNPNPSIPFWRLAATAPEDTSSPSWRHRFGLQLPGPGASAGPEVLGGLKRVFASHYLSGHVC